jgi:hypothetical protein
MAVVAIGGLLTGMYYAVTAIGTYANPAESKRRALIAGGLTVGTIALVSIGGEASVRRRRAYAT